MEINKIYNEDCITTMRRLPVNTIDIILTSPPYNTSRKGSSLDNACANIRYDEFNDCRSNEEYCEWTRAIFMGFDRVLKKNGCVLYNLSYSSENTEAMYLCVADIIRNTPFTIAEQIVWKKQCASPNSCSSNKLTRICEYVFVFCRKIEFNTFKCNKPISSIRTTGQKAYANIFNFIEAANNDGPCDIHKATYSTELCRKLLNIYKVKGGICYDPFMGTGTTAIACHKEDMNYIGSEISKRYCEYAKERIFNETRQLSLQF